MIVDVYCIRMKRGSQEYIGLNGQKYKNTLAGMIKI
jgi:hypothetical protein